MAEARDSEAGVGAGTVLASIAGILAAFVALVYVAGGAILWLRTAELELPAGSVIAYLPREFLISVGLREVVLPLVVIAIIASAVAFGISRLVPGRWFEQLAHDDASEERRPTRPRRIVSLVVLSMTVAVVAVLVGNVFAAGQTRGSRLLMGLAAAMLAAWLVLAKGLMRWHEQGRLTIATAGVLGVVATTLAFTPIAILYAHWRWTPQTAIVCVADGEPLVAMYVGETADRIYLGERLLYENERDRPGFGPHGKTIEVIYEPHIISVPKRDASRLYVGQLDLVGQKGVEYFCGE